MIDLHDLSSIGALISEPWRPVLIAAATIVGGLLVAAAFSKAALGRIEGGLRSLVIAGWERTHGAPTGRGGEIPVAPDSDTAPTHGLDYAPETPKPGAAGSPCPADPAAGSADVYTADGEQILGRYCKMDTASTVEGLEFTMEAPGLKESDLEISLVGDTIVIVGRVDPDRAGKTYRVIEREFGAFSRFIKISDGVPLHRIQASLDRGLLTVFVPNPIVQVGTIAVNSAVRRVFDGDDLCELKLDLPGVDASDVDLAVRDGVLTISRRRGPQAANAGDQAGNAFAPRLLQSMELPAGVDASQIRAVLAKGVLTVTLPIGAGHRQRTIPLDSVEVSGRAEMRPRGGGADTSPPAGRGRSEAATGAHVDPPFDVWGACQALSGNGVSMNESTARRT